MNQKFTTTIFFAEKLTLLFAIFLLICCIPSNGFSRPTENPNFNSRIVKQFSQLVLQEALDASVMNEALTTAPCPGGSGVIGGVAFQDFNYNGIDDQVGAGLAGIGVHIFGEDETGSSESVGSTTTDTEGTYHFSGLTDGVTYRIEFIIPSSLDYLKSGFNGADSRTTVQFITSPSCDASIGLATPADFCEADPFLAIPCYVNGDPLAEGSGSAGEEALVTFKSSFEGGNPKPTNLATAAEIGSTWGVTYHKSTKSIYASAFLKRHVGFGPLGMGGLYKIDISGTSPVVTPFIDVNSIGINVGNYPSNAARGLSANVNLPNNDTQTFDEVGKKGIGGMCMSSDGSKMYLVNITENKLHAIDMDGAIPTSNDVDSYTIPNPNCNGGAFRAFAVNSHGQNVYVAGVCDAEASGNKSDLRAIVYRLDGNNFTEVLNASLDYTKGLASRSCSDGGWFPWRNTIPEACFESGNTQIVVYPTPHLTALEFDDNGDLILGFSDRMGNQLGFKNFGLTGNSPIYSSFTGGEILKAGKNQDGSFTLENNGQVNGVTTNGANNGEGPGGGEFYFWDAYDIGVNIPRPHSETAQGGLAIIKGSGQVISTALDPYGTSVNSGGVNYFNNETGEVRDPGYRVFRSGASSPASFSKANGLGDLVPLCGEAPLEIGGRLWVDANKDGIQDPSEKSFSGVNIALYAANGEVLEIIETDSNGEYYFNGVGSGIATITPNSEYYVVIGFGSQYDNANRVLLDSFILTTANTGMGANPDLNDSDAIFASNAGIENNFQNWPFIRVLTGDIGDVNHQNDAGFFVEAVELKANISGFVWNDLDENGIQENGEPGISGVTLNLISDNTFLFSTTTDGVGNYLIENIVGGDYAIVFDASSSSTMGSNLKVTSQNVGDNDNIDSDIGQDDERVDFNFEPEEGDVEFDAGYYIPGSQIIGFVFNDQNGDGLQGNNDPGIGGVTVTLYNANGTEMASLVTDANGNYVFDDIPEGEYYIDVDVSTNTNGNPNFEGTIENAGDDKIDSDVNPNSGESSIFSHNPSNGNSDIDAGFIDPSATISGTVWADSNENGLQNDGEAGISGVTVQLIDDSSIIVGSRETDANGNYSFPDVKSGNFTLVFDPSDDPVVGDNYETTIQNAGDDAIDSDINQSTNSVSFDFDASAGNADFDAGFILPLANITGVAFDDTNKNGLQDIVESLIPGVKVILFNSNGIEQGFTTTDASGTYIFVDITKGDYYLSFDISSNSAGIDDYVGTIQNAGNDDNDSDVDPTSGQTSIFSFDPSDGDAKYDAGYYVLTGSITGTVFIDHNENGLQDINEVRVGGVEVIVLAEDGTSIGTSTTNSDGFFMVDNIPSGVVTVLFDPYNNSQGIENFTPTIKDVNNNQNDDIDSDINPNRESDPIQFAALVGADVDAGFLKPAEPVMVGDFVFKDCNGNGIQEANEKGVPNVPVTLRGYDKLGQNVEMKMTTNSMGKFLFTVSKPGTYTLDFDIPDGVTGLSFSPKNRGGQEVDSDVNPLSGATDAFVLESGEENLSIDAGIIDNSPPLIFNVPPDVIVECNDIPNPPNSVKGVDNCDPFIPVSFSERVINAGSCPYIIERTWEAVDECGNSTVRTQKITVTDTKAPVITVANPILLGLENGGEIVFDCDNLPEFSAADVNAVDECSDVEVTFVDLVRDQGDCEQDGYIVKMTCGWIAVDDCGNRSEYNIVIYVVDTKSPVLVNVPEDITVNADQGEFIPPFANTVTATDNCDEYVRIETSEESSSGVCGTEIIRTWIGYDDCGNKAIDSQKITVLEDCTCPKELVSNTLVWDAACDGSEGGKIILDLTADLNKYDISITPNTGAVNFSGNMFTDLVPGDYTIEVNYESTEDCSEVYHFTVNMATPATIEVLAQTKADCNTSNGMVTLSPPSYAYIWNDGGTGAQRDDLAAGEYIVTFTDENKCQGAQVVIVRNPDNCECVDFSANLVDEILPTCNNYTNGQVNIEIVGGLPPYTYEWHNGQTTRDLYGVTGGPYALTVTDANHCETTLEGELNQSDAILVSETLKNGACGEKGAIDLYVSGGVPPYKYNWNNGETIEDLTNLPTGSYSVTVTDSKDCNGNLTVSINNSGAINIDLSSSNPTCSNSNNGRVSAAVYGGQNPLKYEWSNGATTSTIENVGTGTYAVMVTDANGCSSMEEVTLIGPDMIMVDMISSSADCAKGEVDITLSINGGVAPFQYNWGNGQSTESINVTTEGAYSVTVTDANGCTGMSNIDVKINAPFEVESAVNTPKCSDENGSINLELTGGEAPYTYQWNNGATTKDLVDVAPGSYSVIITDGNKCEIIVDAEIPSSSDLTISNNPINPSCSGDNNGRIDVSINGGVQPYSYLWNNGATSKDLVDLSIGTYTLVVTDANGCTISTTAVLETPSALSASVESTMPLCLGMVGSIDLTVTGGSGIYTYEWDFGATSEDIDGLIEGEYSVMIKDESGCELLITTTIEVPSAIESTINITNPGCSGENGQIDLTVYGGTAPYSFGWSNGAGSEDLVNVAPGSYNVLITDANGCTTLASATVESTAGLGITSNISNAKCSGLAGGSIDIEVVGGTAPYTYSWTNGSTSKAATDLMPGVYSVLVTDANGCELMETYTIEAPSTILVETEMANPDCSDALGKINITVSGGVYPYTFNWSNGATTEDINDVPAGNYSVTITDDNGCTTTATSALTAPIALYATAQITDQDCEGDGNIDLTVTGGTAPYSYLWSNGAITEDLNKVGGGTYQVVITDANNCKLTYEVSVESTGGIQILVSGAEPTCYGSSNGSLSIEVQGGTLPYAYQWSNGSQAAGINNIPAGSYSVTVTDAKGCSLVGPAVLGDLPEITSIANPINPKCAEEFGSIDLTTTGGVGELTFKWNNGATTEDISGLTPGGYSVTITDANGCTHTTTTNILAPPTLVVEAMPVNPGCEEATGSINLSVSGGTAPYTFNWNNGSFDQNITNVASGTYTVVVADANGCNQSATATIDNIESIVVSIDGITDPRCAGSSNGSISTSISGGVAPYTYLWNNGATTEDLSDLLAGTYTGTVSDARGCQIVLEAILNDIEGINIATTVTNPACPGDVGSINVSVTGGTPPYQYHWNNGATTQGLSDVVAGNYQVTVTDAFGCIQTSDNISVNDPEDFSIDLTATDVLCYGETNGLVNLSVNGPGNYTYAWSNGQTTQDISNLDAGTYSVTVTNDKGCYKTSEATVNIPPAISLGMTYSNPRCPTDLGAINIEVLGGTPPYSYLWSNGATTQNLVDLPAGRYTIIVTDANGCSLDGAADIRAATEITAAANITNQDCFVSGAIDMDISGGTAPYTYQWNTGATSQDLTDLAPGNYEVTITDNKGCYITQQAVIIDDCVCPTPLVNQNMVTNSRCGEANGSIMIMVNGDIEDFQFEWTPEAGTPGAYNNERTNLPAGTYDVLVTYGTQSDCSEMLRLSIGNKDGLTGSVVSNTPATCGESNGHVVFQSGVTYFWPDGSESKDRDNLAAGVYTIKTLDPSGCKGALVVTVAEEPCNIICDLAATIDNAKAPDCDGNLGSLDLNVSGGTAPYEYNWNNEAIGNVEDPSDLLAGTYSVIITDANKCTVSLSITLDKKDCGGTNPTENPNPSSCDLMVSLQTIDLTCHGAGDGSIIANVLNGKAPFIYNWSTGQNTQSIENLSNGEYRLEVIDADGCRVNTKVQLNSPGIIVVSEIRTVLDCESIEVKLNISGGRAPYEWECGELQGALLDPLNLVPGNYSCIVTDGSGCTVTHAIEIEDYQSLAVSGIVKNTTCGQEDGSIDLTPTGGTAPYTFDWDCGLYGDEDQFNLGPHTYNVTVTDATNCTTTATYTIEDCSGEGFGFIAINAVSLGNLSVQVEWETANESMAGNYVLLHSTDGENFEVLGGIMEGKGPIASASYKMEESVTYGKNYFKVKYIDANGVEIYSEVTETLVFIDGSTGRVGIAAVIYPNPTFEEFSLDFARPIDAVINVMVTDMDGVVIESIDLLPGTAKHVFDLRTYESGVYNISLQQRRKKLKTYRLIKTNDR